MVRAASGSQSPVDMAFNDIFEVIQAIEEMPNTAQIVPSRDDCSTELFEMQNENFRGQAKIYGSDLNLADTKPEATASSNYQPLNHISGLVGLSLQLDRTRAKPEPEPFLRDFPTAFPDDVLWGEKLINDTKNLIQYPPFFSRDLSENYRNFPVPEGQEMHIVPELGEKWLDTPEVLFADNEEIIPKTPEDSNFSEYSSDSEPPFEVKKVDEAERMSESPDSFSSRLEAHSPWFEIDSTNSHSPLVITKRPTEVKKEIKKCKSSFKSGRPRLCQFLLELLSHPEKYSHLIEWIDKERGVFKFLNSSRVAQEWGERRNKPRMKYENFARSLRTYIAKGILTKPRSKLVYKFA
ncbi:ETS translocation variant 1-like [Actinia tenebrosa]|uniref:ETS translocation variant 1-like n=1 Tax=Actinia tenebrosa TaxID=6105 RepID=A0A6P8IPZ9_ACTTE|nr:ETS translocation variant 1-like [Actinia tenebrosa]XP_031569142.1 ETS translocation variant 1-like [Actinia tenebrosa]